MLWILAIVLLGVFALAGYTLGAVRLAASVLGLLLGWMLAVPMGHVAAPIVKLCGATNPVLIWLLGPFVVFCVIVLVFQSIGVAINHQVEVYYKYKAPEVMVGLWKRLNPRLGMCLGLVNASLYMILLSWIIYAFSYYTYQLENTDTAAFSVRMLNNLGAGLQSSGMNKVAAAIDKMPESYYQFADVVGLIYHNDLLEGRLARYPAFFGLAERQQFKDIANDKDFTELRQKAVPFADIYNHPKVQAIVGDPAFLTEVWGVITPNLADLQGFLQTGQSAKYDDNKLLGRWDFDVAGSMNALKRAKPTLNAADVKRTRAYMRFVFANTTLVAAPEPEKAAFLKRYGKIHPPAQPKEPPTVDELSFTGTWSGEGTQFEFNFPDKGGGSLQATVDGDRLLMTGDTYPMAFTREF
jgi:hypothetical protein